MIGKNIKDLRNEKELSLRALAALAGISKSTLSDIENGNNSPSVNTIEKISKALQVSLTEVLVGPEDSFSIKLLMLIQGVYGNKINPIGNDKLFDILSKELDIDDKELFLVYNNKSNDLPTVIQNKLLDYLKGLDDEAYYEFINDYPFIRNEIEKTDNIDDDMKAIIEALKNASPNKRAKILKMIELFEDEK